MTVQIIGDPDEAKQFRTQEIAELSHNQIDSDNDSQEIEVKLSNYFSISLFYVFISIGSGSN